MTDNPASVYRDGSLNFRDRAGYWQRTAAELRRAAEVCRAKDRFEAAEVAIESAKKFEEIAAREYKEHATGVIDGAIEALPLDSRSRGELREVLEWLRTGKTPTL